MSMNNNSVYNRNDFLDIDEVDFCKKKRKRLVLCDLSFEMECFVGK